WSNDIKPREDRPYHSGGCWISGIYVYEHGTGKPLGKFLFGTHLYFDYKSNPHTGPGGGRSGQMRIASDLISGQDYMSHNSNFFIDDLGVGFWPRGNGKAG